ncbi:MAG: replication factor C large subunit [Methanobrevibacter sp.]|nr:replication factor C large subunit [Methanobrevibacter sp.]
MLLTDKYRPKLFKEIIGNGKQKKEIESWLENWKNDIPQPCLLLIGPAGTGKTSIAHIIASHFSEFIELNASDKRSFDIIMNTVGESATTHSLYSKERKLIILDEVDGIHGNDDRGGTRAIGKIIKTSKHPIVMTANDFYSKRLTSIKPKCQVIKINKVHTNSINALLKKICKEEGVVADPIAIKELAKRSNGDMRSALNTLQVITDKDKKLELSDLDIISSKDNTNNIFDSVRRVLKSKSIDKIKKSLMLDEDPTLVMEYIAENIPREYEKPKEIKKAYEMISEADFYFGKARSTRNYTYWRYATEFMGLGVALAKDETYKKFTRLTGSMAFTLMGRTRGKRALRDRITDKMSKKLHVSSSVAISMFPEMEIMFENDEVAYEIASYLDLDDDEIKRFRKKKIPKKVIKLMEKRKLEEKAKSKKIKRSSFEVATKIDDKIDVDKITKSKNNNEENISKTEDLSTQNEEKIEKKKEEDSAQKSLFSF